MPAPTFTAPSRFRRAMASFVASVDVDRFADLTPQGEPMSQSRDEAPSIDARTIRYYVVAELLKAGGLHSGDLVGEARRLSDFILGTHTAQDAETLARFRELAKDLPA